MNPVQWMLDKRRRWYGTEKTLSNNLAKETAEHIFSEEQLDQFAKADELTPYIFYNDILNSPEFPDDEIATKIFKDSQKKSKQYFKKNKDADVNKACTDLGINQDTVDFLKQHNKKFANIDKKGNISLKKDELRNTIKESKE